MAHGEGRLRCNGFIIFRPQFQPSFTGSFVWRNTIRTGVKLASVKYESITSFFFPLLVSCVFTLALFRLAQLSLWTVRLGAAGTVWTCLHKHFPSLCRRNWTEKVVRWLFACVMQWRRRRPPHTCRRTACFSVVLRCRGFLLPLRVLGLTWMRRVFFFFHSVVLQTWHCRTLQPDKSKVCDSASLAADPWPAVTRQETVAAVQCEGLSGGLASSLVRWRRSTWVLLYKDPQSDANETTP